LNLSRKTLHFAFVESLQDAIKSGASCEGLAIFDAHEHFISLSALAGICTRISQL